MIPFTQNDETELIDKYPIPRRPPLPGWATPLVFVLTTLAIVACVIIGNIVGGR